MTNSVWHDRGSDMGRVEINGPDLRGLQCPAKRVGLPSNNKEPVIGMKLEIIWLYSYHIER